MATDIIEVLMTDAEVDAIPCRGNRILLAFQLRRILQARGINLLHPCTKHYDVVRATTVYRQKKECCMEKLVSPYEVCIIPDLAPEVGRSEDALTLLIRLHDRGPVEAHSITTLPPGTHLEAYRIEMKECTEIVLHLPRDESLA